MAGAARASTRAARNGVESKYECLSRSCFNCRIRRLSRSCFDRNRLRSSLHEAIRDFRFAAACTAATRSQERGEGNVEDFWKLALAPVVRCRCSRASLRPMIFWSWISRCRKVTITATAGLSAVDASGSDTIGVYFENFYGGRSGRFQRLLSRVTSRTRRTRPTTARLCSVAVGDRSRPEYVGRRTSRSPSRRIARFYRFGHLDARPE